VNDSTDAAHAVLAGFALGREAAAAGVTLDALQGGLDNASWRARSAAGDWVIRIAGDRDQRFQINRVAERQTQAAAAALGFAPAILYADPARGVLVSEYLGADVWTRERARTADGIRTLGARLGALHAAPVPKGVRRLDVHSVLAHYLELPGVAPGPVSRAELGARLRWSLATYRPAAAALCHNDLHHRNLIGAAPLRFIDWEYGGVGDPLFELAAVCGYHDYDAEQRALLLEAHGGGLDAAHAARMCLVFDCLHALWLDAADGWRTLDAPRQHALIERISIDPALRER
jgi:thiamine kinase